MAAIALEAGHGNRRLRFRPAEVAIVCVAMGVPAGLAMGSYRAAAIGDTGEILGDSQFVALRPETWVGRRFPLLNHIDIGGQIAEGQWIVALYRRDCPHCREAIQRLKALGRGLPAEPGGPQVALIEMPRYDSAGDSSPFRIDGCAYGRLGATKEWFMETPVEMRIVGGVVIAVKCGEQPLHDAWGGQVTAAR